MNRLIWFIHFHKAGGSSVVELARRNRESLPSAHANGNPLDTRGKQRPTWELSPQGLSAYIDGLKTDGTTFVASEWGVPDLTTLDQAPTLVTLAAIREPLERIISNFRFDYRSGFTSARTVLDYVDHIVQDHTRSEYYCRQLLGSKWQSDADPRVVVDSALAQLALVDHVVLLDGPRAMEQLAGRLGWLWTPVNEKRNELATIQRARLMTQFVRRGRGDLAWRSMRPAPEVTPEERQTLRSLNRMDLMLWSRLVDGVQQMRGG